MRIAIAGASGTGKTTLARALAQHYDIPLNPIGARSVALDMGFADPYQIDAAGRRVEFQERLFQEKQRWELEHEDFVTDRTYFDNLAYCALHMSDQLPDGTLSKYSLAMKRYEFVFAVARESFQDLSDGIRKTNDTYHALYEVCLGGLFEWHRLRAIIVPFEGAARFTYAIACIEKGKTTQP